MARPTASVLSGSAMRPLRRAVLAAVLAMAGSACSVGPDYHPPALDVPARFGAAVPLANSFAQEPVPADANVQAPGGAWWKALADPELDSLVDRALAGNPGLEVALIRLQQARTLRLGLYGLELPRVNAGSGGGRGTGSDLARGRAPSSLASADRTLSDAPHIDRVSGLDAVWDIDIFGRLRRQIEASGHDVQAVAAARDAVQVALVADVVRAYAELRGTQAQRRVQEQALASSREQLRLIAARLERGIGNEYELALAQRQAATIEADLAVVSSREPGEVGALAALLGRFPGQLAAELQAADGPASTGLVVPARVSVGLPVDLVRRRPDVRLAEQALAADTARIGVAVGNLFPQLSLNAGVGVQGEGPGASPLHDQRVWSAGYSAVVPLLDFGVLDALVKVADLQARARLVQYRAAVLGAVQEVDAAMAAYSGEQQALRSLDRAMAASLRATELATQRYERGLSDFLAVTDAQRQQYELAAQYVGAQVALAGQFAALHRALGGGWEGYEPPPVSRPLPAIAALLGRALPQAPASSPSMPDR